MAKVSKRFWTNDQGANTWAWVVRFTDLDGKRRLKTFDRLEDAERFRRYVLADQERGFDVRGHDGGRALPRRVRDRRVARPRK